MELNWITKNRAGGTVMSCDVKFSLCKNKSVDIAISASSIATKLHGCTYIQFAISGNRIYFRASDEKYGYKLTRQGVNKAGKAHVTNEDLLEFIHKNPQIREANFRFDSVNDLYLSMRLNGISTGSEGVSMDSNNAHELCYEAENWRDMVYDGLLIGLAVEKGVSNEAETDAVVDEYDGELMYALNNVPTSDIIAKIRSLGLEWFYMFDSEPVYTEAEVLRMMRGLREESYKGGDENGNA